MILEAIAYFKERRHTPKEYWGFVHQLVALQFRYQRNKSLWDSHLKRCHQVINESIHATRPEEIIILGSGLALEFPLHTILKEGPRLTLVDLVFPSDIVKIAKQHPDKIRMIKKDLTGGVQLADLDEPSTITKKTTEAFADLPEGFVISCNILSQLPLMKLAFSKDGTASDSQALYFAKLICEAHVNALKRKFTNGIIISDFCRNELGQKVKEELNTLPINLDFQQQWTWHLEGSRRRQISLLVGAIDLPSLPDF